MIPKCLYYQNNEYTHISALSPILINSDLKQLWKIVKNDSKLQIIKDEDYNVIKNTLGIDKPNYIIPISRCKIIQEYYENIQHYIRLNCLSNNEINFIQNL